VKSAQPSTVTLPSELAAFVERCVASGRFASPHHVILEAVEVLREHEEGDSDWAANVRREIEIGVDQANAGQLRSGSTVFEELRQPIRRG
jgi:putative addiction module CopG family antidote